MELFKYFFKRVADKTSEPNSSDSSDSSDVETFISNNLKSIFPTLVQNAASNILNLKYVNVYEWHVNVGVRSNSGKTTWEFDLYFDDGNDNFTENCTRGISGYTNASAPIELARAIINEVRSYENLNR
ncbi:hypothetical protein CKN73_13450 [Carnobacterium divergens]|uniref:hypothetical protein n=1 Tax=Carnobacterium TaxID=2747 RepID=UPI000552A120|nr:MULTISPECIES: hypothetical protein [Carnobacterium]AOA04107.1 hypothetical protein BFC23_16440 [Carnobacterium maltaromaticum]TFJ37482.1 hypothetical protein CKN77_13295 [Carnobacterium divergens]TFJ46537.1 hypothetical protein CKN73_13450 [Carnobacterium divergens]TFJ50805.1 hypothetical protein CKN83_13505 [Carnobacterium divergens]TFJ54371.1 hypothetical protein CKN96_16270 [Carnobacterium maltaromaticum]